MNNTSQSDIAIPVTGAIPYGMTNDYIFHMLWQRNTYALKGLISSVLHLKFEDIRSVRILNPIEQGDVIDAKTFILDINLLMNDNTLLNLEMQVAQEDWQSRSLSYLCRTFDQLDHGQEYFEARPAIHIGFLDFNPFPEVPEFFGTYQLLNVKNHRLYSDKLTLHVIDLSHIELATEEDRDFHIDEWARFLTATNWEEVHMLSENNDFIRDAAGTLQLLNAYTPERERARAAVEYRRTMNSYKRKVEQLTNDNAQLTNDNAQLEWQLAEQRTIIAELQAKIAELENQQ